MIFHYNSLFIIFIVLCSKSFLNIVWKCRKCTKKAYSQCLEYALNVLNRERFTFYHFMITISEV